MKQHGVNGVFYGGEWLDIESCEKAFNIKDGSDKLCGDKCDVCPRSRSRNATHTEFDVIVIGAGCVGGSVARELAKHRVRVLVLEAADDVSQGATKGNSGIVHAGYDDIPGTVRAKFCWPGNQMFPQLDRELRFGYQRNGSLVLATTEGEVRHLYELKERGEKNGVQNLRVLSKDETRAMEPKVSDDVIGALYAPDAGNVIPYEFAIALMENAVDNGVELRIRREVTGIQREGDLLSVTARYWEPKTYVDLQEAAKKGSEATISSSKSIALAEEKLAEKQRALASKKATSRLWLMLGFAVGIFAVAQHAVGFGKGVWTGFGVAVAAVAFFATYISGSNRGGSSAAARQSDKKQIENGVKKVVPPSVGKGGEAVKVADMATGGSGSSAIMQGQTVAQETFKARFVINCAGSGADKIAALVGDKSFVIKPRLGDYLLFNRSQGNATHCTLFPCPGPLGKGVLVQQTLWGNLILGPTARDVHVKEAMEESTQQIHQFILAKCAKLVKPGTFDPKEVIHAFCGARAKSSRGDWIVEHCATEQRMIHVAGIDSPGLAGCPAIAKEVVAMLGRAGLELKPNEHFNPNRAALIVPKRGYKGLKMSQFAARPRPYGDSEKKADGDDAPKVDVPPEANVICKCERVTEAEVIEAVHRSLPIDSTQAIRKRVRAGMGHCQGDASNYNCECRVAEIIARETNVPVEMVGRRPWPATSTLPQRWLTPEEKLELEKAMQVPKM